MAFGDLGTFFVTLPPRYPLGSEICGVEVPRRRPRDRALRPNMLQRYTLRFAAEIGCNSTSSYLRLTMPKYVVRHGRMRLMAIMAVRGTDLEFHRGDKVVVRTSRGLELGEVLCEATPETEEQVANISQGEILRGMTANDACEAQHMAQQAGNEFEICQRYVDKLKLTMDIVDIEYLFGGERIVVYYLAEKRVDFRELVRQLAREFQTRVEMRQIGVRDEAKLLADYGDCGQPVCCGTYLSSMPPVSMKMAKVQKATLDPTKISGRCGRLKCCLRYEYDTYVELQRELPPVGSEIVTSNGKATILAQEILASQLLVETEDNRRIMIDNSDVLSITRRGRAGGDSRRKRKPKIKKNDSSD